MLNQRNDQISRLPGWPLSLLIAAFVVFVAASALAQKEAPVAGAGNSPLKEWREFASASGGFGILFPNKPKQEVGAFTVSKMPIKSFSFTSNDNAAYTVMYF